MGEVRAKTADLFVAISSKNVSFVEKVLDMGADVNCVMRMMTPLHSAICNKMIDIIRLLISRGADVNAKGTDDKHLLEPPLVAACRMNVPNIAEVLLECKRLDVDQVDFFGYSALYYAAGWGNVDLISKLLSLGANINIATRNANSPLHMTAVRQPTKRGMHIAHILIQRGCYVDNQLLTSLIQQENFQTFRLALRASYCVYKGICTPSKKRWKMWRKESKAFCHWLNENKNSIESSPLKLKTIVISFVRRTLIKNYKSIQDECLDLLCVPILLKKQILLLC